jgi:hypothetical protein
MESEEIELLTISALEHAVLLTDPHQRGQVAMCVNKVAVEARGRHWNRVLRFADAIDVQVDAPASPQSP